MHRKSGGQVAPSKLHGYDYEHLDLYSSEIIREFQDKLARLHPHKITYPVLATAKEILQNYQMLLPFSDDQTKILALCFYYFKSYFGLSLESKSFLRQFLILSTPYSALKTSKELLWSDFKNKTIDTKINSLLPNIHREINAALYPLSSALIEKKQEKILTAITITAGVASALLLLGAFASKPKTLSLKTIPAPLGIS